MNDTFKIAEADGSPIREATSQYWKPSYYNQSEWDAEGKKIEKPEQSKLWSILAGVLPQGILTSYHKEDKFDFDVRVRIAICYPLHDVHAVEVTLRPSRFGEVFAITHDLYKEIYDQDDADWAEKGEDKAPRLTPKMLNRARGSLVWGHDMSDLVFEGMEFSMEPQWPMAIRKSRVIIPEFDENGVAKVESLKEKMANPDMVTNPEELGQQHRELCPLLGTVTFSIGS